MTGLANEGGRVLGEVSDRYPLRLGQETCGERGGECRLGLETFGERGEEQGEQDERLGQETCGERQRPSANEVNEANEANERNHPLPYAEGNVK